MVEMINKYKDKSTKYTMVSFSGRPLHVICEHPKVLKTNGVINLEQAQGGSCFTCFALECHVQWQWFRCRWSVAKKSVDKPPHVSRIHLDLTSDAD